MSEPYSPWTCVACGKGQVTLVAKPGRTAPYHNEVLPIPASLEIPTCSACGEEWLDLDVTLQLDAALKLEHNSRVDRMERRKALRCSFCRPHRGENKTYKRRGVKKPRKPARGR